MNYPVAVIIPVYKNDTPQYVRPAIDSIIKQTYSCRIYIGVDGPIGNSLNSCLEAYETICSKYVSTTVTNTSPVWMQTISRCRIASKNRSVF